MPALPDAPAVLFDLDGTLTDPKPGITRCIQHALTQMGLPPPPEDDLLWCIGPPLQKSFGILLNSADAALQKQALAHYRERFSTTGLYENTVYPEIPAALRTLRAGGCRLFVATSKPHVYATRILEHFKLLDLFDAVHGSELDGTRTDKGELLAHLLATELLHPARVIMIGDREHDALGARKNDLPCLGVTYGYGSAAELRAAGAFTLAPSPADLPPLVLAHFGTRDIP